jgi:hypothetical protein
MAWLLAVNSSKVYLEILRQIDCIYWNQRKYPLDGKGQYNLHFEECVVILEDLHHMISGFGMVGSQSNINALECSPMFSRLAEDISQEINYEITCHNTIRGHV